MSTQTITFECRVSGRVVPHVLEVSTSAGFDQINAEATIWTTARPSWADERNDAEIYARNSATGQGWLFRGEVTGFDWTYAPTKVGIVLGDLLARTRDEWGDEDVEYSEQTSAAVIRNVCEKNAIPSSKARIEGDDWTVGVINPVVLKNGSDGYSTVIQPLDDMEGYRTFSLTSGTILRTRISGAPGPSAALTFDKGVEILANPRHTRTVLGIVNKVIITGVDYEGLTVGGPGVGEASAPNPYVSNVSGYSTERIQSNLVEDDATALLFAQRRVSDKNRRPETGEFRVPLEPRLQPGMTVVVNHPDLELGSTRAFCQHVAHEISPAGAFTTFRTVGGQISGIALQPPVANFTVDTAREGQDTGSGVVALVDIICDGSGSFDPDGTIASYAWAVSTDGTATPSSGSGPVFRAIVSGATTITVTLTVTDNDGLTGALPLTVPLDSGNLKVEDIYLAFGTASCSSDGQQTWRDATPASGDATCLMPIAPAWGQLWGTTTGHLYATFDKLQSPLVDLGVPHGAVACTAVWVHEVDPTRLWAGFADGKVYFGTLDIAGQTATWTLHSTIPDGPIREIRESYGTFGELRATAGAGYYYTTGTSWSVQHTFDTAWRMAAGFDTNLTSGLNDAAPLYDEDGTPPTVPGGVTHIRGLSFGWRQQELYAADNTAALYLGAAPSFNLSLSADATDAIANHMIRSGNLDRIVYLAIGDGTGSNNGFQKWIPEATAPFYIRKTGSDAGQMIAYGALHPPELTYRIYAGWDNADPGGLSLWEAGVWTSKPLPVSGAVRCLYVAGSGDKILAFFNGVGAGRGGIRLNTSGGTVQGEGWAHSPLWYSPDKGTTWTPISLTTPGSGLAGEEAAAAVQWDTADGWVMTMPSVNAPGGAFYTGTNGTANAPTPTPSKSVSGVRYGDGEFIFLEGDGGDALLYGLSLTQPPGATSDYGGLFDRLPGTRQVVGVDAFANVIGAGDYRAAQPIVINPSLNARAVAASADAVYIIDGTGALQRVVNIFAGGTATQVPGALFVGSPVSDRQSQTVTIALVDSQTQLYVITGGAAHPLNGPVGITLSGGIEVVTI